MSGARVSRLSGELIDEMFHNLEDIVDQLLVGGPDRDGLDVGRARRGEARRGVRLDRGGLDLG